VAWHTSVCVTSLLVVWHKGHYRLVKAEHWFIGGDDLTGALHVLGPVWAPGLYEWTRSVSWPDVVQGN